MLIIGCELLIDDPCGCIRRIHDLGTEGLELRAVDHELLQGIGIARTWYLACISTSRERSRSRQYRLVVRGQISPFRLVDHDMQRVRALLPAGKIIGRRNLLQAEPLIVMGPCPLRGIERPVLEGQI